jgi:phage antirepressor YoqD-like protein
MLASDEVIFKRDGVRIPTQAHLDAGRFMVRTGVRHGFAFNQMRVTPKGVVWLAKRYSRWLWIEEKLRNALRLNQMPYS